VKIKLDENLPADLVEILGELGHKTDTVPQEGMKGYGDDRLWPVVLDSGRFFVTQDLDFSDVRRFVPGTHPGLMVVRLLSAGRQELLDRLTWVFENEAVATWAGCHVVVTAHKVRVRRPASGP